MRIREMGCVFERWPARIEGSWTEVKRDADLPERSPAPYRCVVTTPRAILVGDAHLGATGRHVEEAFHEFLRTVPEPRDHLVIMGDLFDFWFEYRRVVSRRHVTTIAALRAARERGVVISFIGGNHDRWGGSLFRDDLGIPFHASGQAHMSLAGRAAFLHHGDGLAEQHWSARFMHFLTRQRLTVAAFQALHPDLGYWLADRISRRLADKTRNAAALDRASAAQAEWARDVLAHRPEVEIVAAAHTHRPVLEEIAGRYYVNPGAFMDDGQHAIITADDLQLATYSG